MLEQSKFAELKNDFITKYTNHFLPEVQNIIKRRKTVNIIIITLCSIAVIAIIFLAFYPNTIIRLSSFGVAVILAFASCKILNIFKEKARDEIMQNFAKTLDGVAWRWGKYPEKMAIKMSCVTSYFETVEVKNTFFGTYDSVDYEIVECNLKNGINVFSGLVFRIKLNRDSQVHTVVRMEKTNFAATRPTLRPIGVDEMGIDKKYHVFSENENEAKSLLRAGLTTKIEQAQTALNMPFVGAAFCKGDLFMAFKNKNELFELYPVLKNQPKAFEQYSNFFQVIVAIYDLIEFFKNK